MEYIERNIESDIKEKLFKGKVIIVYGPRQCGKTTMIAHICKSYGDDVLWLNADVINVRDTLSDMSAQKWLSVIGNKKIVVIDEAQRIPNIGLSMKIFVDEIKDRQLIASGSSSFDLANKTEEPLTGRKYEYTLLPLSFAELTGKFGLIEEKGAREQRLLFGSYPDVVNNPQDTQRILGELASSYLYRDVLAMEGIKRPALLDKIVRALALQIGSEVKIQEISNLTNCDAKTVEKYINLLEKSFVVFSLPAFSRNLRNEIKKGRKVYFYDIGIRNAILGNFVPLHSRTDSGAMWENYLVAERLKQLINAPFPPRRFFWRTTDQREVDYIEETPQSLSAWEFKSNPKLDTKLPAAFLKAYPTTQTACITPKNYEEFVG